jgi:type IV pilus biogenesis protein CpaD/CtpE
MNKLINRALLAGAVLMLAGCEDLDPYHRQYVWYPTGASEANVAAMVANPHDMIRGHGNARADGAVAEGAVARLRQDHAKPLPDPGGSSGGGGGGAGAGGGG